MSFEEEFCSLAGEELIKLKISNGHQLLYDKKQIRTHCLDKQRVENAINKLKREAGYVLNGMDVREEMVSVMDLKRELGL